MKVGDLVGRDVVSVAPDTTVRAAVRSMAEHGVGSAVVLDGSDLVGIATERDVLRAVADEVDLDTTPVEKLMTRDVVTVEADWEVYEAAAEMAARRIRHLVVAEEGRVLGVVSVRDVLLAGERIELAAGNWAVLRDPLTFSVRELRRLQRYLLALRGGVLAGAELDDLIGLVVGSWSFDAPLPGEGEGLSAIPEADRERLREAVGTELPDLQRVVQPSPGWRRRR